MHASINRLGIRSKLSSRIADRPGLLAVLTVTAYGGMRRQQAALQDIYQVRFATYQRTVDIRRTRPRPMPASTVCYPGRRRFSQR